jgi:hypothetical protein
MFEDLQITVYDFFGYLGAKGFQDVARGTDILIPSHYGHTNGFPTEWVAKIGKPFVNIISVQSRDESVDPGYSSPDFAKGLWSFAPF